MSALRRHYMVPQIPKGYPLPPYFSVVVPIARTNLITNPSIETNTTGYTAVGGTIAQSSAEQYHGVYSLAVTPSAGTNSDGVFYGTVALTSGTTYAYSCKCKGTAGKQYTISIATTGGSNLTSYTFTATGRWQWVWGYWTETSSTTRRFYIRKNNHSSAAVFYVDGLQIEAISAGETVSTYIDGDQLGLIARELPAPYYWTGTPHASTSVRSGQTRAGGMVMRLDRYGFVLLAVLGLGLAVPQHITAPLPQADGAFYQGTRKVERSFSLQGRFDDASFPNLQRKIGDLGDVLDRDFVGQEQPLVLLYQNTDECGRVFSDTARIVCSYQGGLEGAIDNLHSEQPSLNFKQWLPFIANDSEAAATLTVQQSIASVNGIVQKDAAGVWSKLGTGASGGTPITLLYAPDGKLYAGGDYTGMGGVANTSRIAYWDGAAWNALGTGAADFTVKALAIGPDGTLYAAGSFSLMGGVANTVRIAKWNGSAWSALGTGANGSVNALAIGPDGSLYAGGDFTLMGGVANTVRIAKWNGSAWSALGTGIDATVDALTFGADGTLYAGGNFANAGGVAAVRVASWNGSVWAAMGAGMNASVEGMTTGPDGRIYAVGFFTTAGTITANRIAVWNGTAWSTLSTGFDNDTTDIVYHEPLFYIAGRFTTASGITFPDGGAIWNGSSFVPIDVDVPTAGAFLYSPAFSRSGQFAIGFSTTGTVIASATTTITVTGTARTYPTLTIKGPTTGTARIFQIVNVTTGRAIYLNYTINIGETAVMVCDPSRFSFTSDFQGDLSDTILLGSNQGDFFLQKGVNVISFYSADSTITATLRWRPSYTSLAGLTP
jgi:hypothetical protein